MTEPAAFEPMDENTIAFRIANACQEAGLLKLAPRYAIMDVVKKIAEAAINMVREGEARSYATRQWDPVVSLQDVLSKHDGVVRASFEFFNRDGHSVNTHVCLLPTAVCAKILHPGKTT